MIGKLLWWIGNAIPYNRYIRAIQNRILLPLHKAMDLEGAVVNVLGFKMRLDPRQFVDSWLWFNAQFYDRAEIDFLVKRFSRQSVFVDVGANIGFWSLRFAYCFADAKICAIEADPATFQILRENVQINGFQNISLANVGVSDNFGELPLFYKEIGNRGANTLLLNANTSNCRHVMVPVKPLAAILADASLQRVDVMKMDIEGLEGKVLKRFFSEAPCSLWPYFICVEITNAPEVVGILENNGYRTVLVGGENRVFALNR